MCLGPLVVTKQSSTSGSSRTISPSTPLGRRIGRTRGDRGAALVEAAIVTPVLLLLVFGLFEMGLLFRDYLGATAAASDGARTASISADDPRADWQVLQSIKRTSAALPEDSLKRIVIFDAGSDPANLLDPQAGCLSGSPAAGSMCNAYTPADWDTYDADKFECDGLVPEPVWCGKDRTSSDTAPSYIGVWMLVTHKYVTGFVGDSIDLTPMTVYRIEPTDL